MGVHVLFLCVCVFVRHHHVINGPSPNAAEFSALFFSCLSQLLTGSVESVFFFSSRHTDKRSQTRARDSHTLTEQTSARGD